MNENENKNKRDYTNDLLAILVVIILGLTIFNTISISKLKTENKELKTIIYEHTGTGYSDIWTD